MAPLLVTALVGVGVKIATDLFAAGAKKLFESAPTGQSFASVLDRTRATAGAGASGVGGASLKNGSVAIPGASLADRSQLLALETRAALPASARAQGAAAYRRLGIEAP